MFFVLLGYNGKYMLYKGYKIRVRCVDWEQAKLLDEYWKLFASHVSSDKLVGLGMNWTDDYLYFDYALGVINDDETLNKIKKIDFSKSEFDARYTEIELPDFDEWETFRGKEKDIKKIYEQEIDCYERPYDYELEYIDGRGNLEIKIHYTDSL